MSFFVALNEISAQDNEVNRRRLFNCIVDERIRWMGERGEDGVAVEQAAIKRMLGHRKGGWRSVQVLLGEPKILVRKNGDFYLLPFHYSLFPKYERGF